MRWGRRDVILGIHCRAKGQPGHAWISVHDGNETTTYGGWPIEDSIIERGQGRGWNGRGTDVRKNIERDIGLRPDVSRYYVVTDKERKALQSALNEPYEWSGLDNCSTWAVRVVEQVTGEQLFSPDPRLCFLAQTPESLKDRLIDLAPKSPTSLQNPLKVVDRSKEEDLEQDEDRTNRVSHWRSKGRIDLLKVTKPFHIAEQEHDRDPTD